MSTFPQTDTPGFSRYPPQNRQCSLISRSYPFFYVVGEEESGQTAAPGRVRLTDGLGRFADPHKEWLVPITGAISQARDRLGEAPLMIDRVPVPLAVAATPGAWPGKRRLMAIDGVQLDMPDMLAINGAHSRSRAVPRRVGVVAGDRVRSCRHGGPASPPAPAVPGACGVHDRTGRRVRASDAAPDQEPRPHRRAGHPLRAAFPAVACAVRQRAPGSSMTRAGAGPAAAGRRAEGIGRYGDLGSWRRPTS